MKFLLIFLIIFLIYNVSATNLGISPGNLEFNGSINEKICRNITIKTDTNGTLIGEVRWLEGDIEKRDIKEYKKDSIDGINIDLPKMISNISGIQNIEVCIISKNPGIYYGSIIYKTQDSYAGVGSWIKVDISNKKERKNEYLSGAIVSLVSKKYSTFEVLLIMSFFVLFFILYYLYDIYKKKD
jgi:hypothetical protein